MSRTGHDPDPGRLRIALVHAHSWPTVRRGGERYLADLAWYLSGSGHRVDVVTGDDARSSTSVVEGVTVRRRRYIAARRLGRWGFSKPDVFALSAWPQLLTHRYDVVHALTPTAASAGRLAGRRTVYTVLGHPTADQFGRRPLDRQLFAAGARAAVRVTSLSRSAADAVRELVGVDSQVLPPGVRSGEFRPLLTPRTGPLRVLFPSDATDPRKGADVLARAFAGVLRARPEARLVHAGPGSMHAALATLDADRATVEAALDRPGVGATEDLPGHYRAATVTVLPSRHEAFGLVLVESLACGTPVVAADTGGPTEIVTGPQVGALSPVGDPDALAAAILRVADLAAEPETAGRCADHARRWDWTESIGPAHEALYRDVVRRGRRQPQRTGSAG